MSFRFRVFTTLFLLVIQTGIAQESVDFPMVDEMIISIRLNRGDILFSEKFSKYLEGYNRLKAVQEQRELNETEKMDLLRVYQLFDDLNSKSELIKPYLSSILEARDKALFHAANDFAPEIFNKAERNFQELTAKFANNAQNQADESINKVILLYREAEFEAVRNKLLSEVRILIAEAKDLQAEKYTPSSYQKVNELFDEVDRILSKRQYNDPSLGQKAADLLEESKHLLYLVQLAKQLNRNDTAVEEYILALEASLRKLETTLNITLSSSNGVKKGLDNVNLAVEELQGELNRQRAMNETLLDSISLLSEEIAVLRMHLGENQNIQRKIDNLKSQLTPHNIKVIQQNGYILLRANGLQFPLGKLQISPEEKNRLEKIGESLRAFSSEKIVIRIGQAAAGNVEYNQRLAEQRAQAVALIIQDAGYIQDARISSEAVLLENSRDTGHAIVDVIIHLSQ